MGTETEVYQELSFTIFTTRPDYAGVIRAIASDTDWEDLYITSTREVFRSFNNNGLTDYEFIGTMEFDIPNLSMKLIGNVELKEELGDN